MSDVSQDIVSLKQSTSKVIAQIRNFLKEIASDEYMSFIKKIGGDPSIFKTMFDDIVENFSIIDKFIVDNDTINNAETLHKKMKKFNEILSRLTILKEQMRIVVSYCRAPQREGSDLWVDDVLPSIVGILNYTQILRFEIIFTNSFSISTDTVDRFIKANESLGSIASISERMEKSEKDADKILSNMKALKKLATMEGLTKSYKVAVKWLNIKVWGFDILNLLSLAGIFFVTVGLFLNVTWVDSVKPEGISIYERFVIILPFVFLSWFASKRSQFLYQIKEEYSYKYNTALAYEGYKEEIKQMGGNKHDEMMERLMEATIENLTRSPLAQFDKNSDHAPYAQFIKEFRNK